MIVVADASAMVEYLLRTRRWPSIDETIEAEATDLHIPALCDVEVCAGLRRALTRRRIDQDRAQEALEIYLDLPLTRHGHEALLARIMTLRANFSPYDVTYVALAEALEAPLLTGDRPLARAVGRHTGIPVILSV